jgi:hypothetical protein
MTEFDQAHEEFLNQLSDEEKKQFAPVKDSQTFLKELHNLGQFAKNNRKWTKLFRSIQKCGDHLAPYFDVVGIVVQSHPEWSAIAWGSFRLVLMVREDYHIRCRQCADSLQLACNYGTFFDKLSDLFDELSQRIPAYDDMSKVLQSLPPPVEVSQNFACSLRAFYVDLFDIFKGIARIFTQKSGSSIPAQHLHLGG